MKVEYEFTKLAIIFQRKFSSSLRKKNSTAIEVALLLVYSHILGWFSVNEVACHLKIQKDKLYNTLKDYKLREWKKLFKDLFEEYAVAELLSLENKSESTFSRSEVVLSLDDSHIHRCGKLLGYLGKWWSGQFHTVLNGNDLLLVVLKVKENVIPVNFCLASKKGRYTNRHDRMKMMISEIVKSFEANSINIKRIPVSMDSWYAKSGLKDQLHEMGFQKIVVGAKKHFVILKKRTKYVKKQVKEAITEEIFNESTGELKWAQSAETLSFRGDSPTFGYVVVLGRRILNQIRCVFAFNINREAEILRIWQRHHFIEEVFKRLKHLLGLGKLSLQGNNGAYTNMMIPFLAYYVLLNLQTKTHKTFAALLRDFEFWKCRDFEGILKAWNLSIVDINKVLKY
jgi:hypothetical protein